jgi:bifunctional non-homologous end joining protein LigD
MCLDSVPVLEGEKLNGRWYLFRMRGKPNEKRKNWLLIKAHDEWERSAKGPDILKQSPRSVVSDRSIEEIAEGKSGKQARRSTRAKAKA